ncbi:MULTISPECIES: DICT sensory domain-containing protein [Bacillus]|uniref:DICT sensory domain-containing protein n=1 Tax=Bacillus TaxID=1386 RepID=UPI00101D7CE1|nr:MULTISPECIES: DICT sensory domain-containing protein [Bacillus]MCA1035830.1 histidine kinase [Bacillus infantis]MDT0162947.1 DICT sensory domain-containing protein [Bacillus sp. AG4(2022)]RYI27606.1 histidine kinase [Bacillus infantis]
MELKKLSLFQECFGQVEGETQKLDNAPLSQLNAQSLKYETKVPQLEYMCLMMENIVLTKKLQGNVYAGFQKFSRTKNVLDRFQAMAEYSNVHIFGENDAAMDPSDGIHYIELPKNSELMREWFLIIDSPVFKSMMVAYDMEGFGVHEVEEGRKFKGVKTSNPQVIAHATKLLTPHIGFSLIG